MTFPALFGMVLSCGGSDTSGPSPSSGVVANVVITSPASSIQVGQSVQFSAEGRNSNNELVNAGDATWSISPTNVASISSKGLVTALAAGNTTITATLQGKTGTLPVMIIDAGIPTVATVFMPGNSFSPFNITIRVNGTVRFEFPSALHNVIFVNRAGAPSDIQQTSSVTVSRTFGTIGVFPYDCTLHSGMSGQVSVVQ